MSQNPNEAKGFYKLSWLQRIGFGAGDMAQNLIYQTVSIWLLFFYTNVYGLAPGAAALMFLIVRLVDVLWDPIVGAFVDKGNPKWGKYRSWLILGGIPLAGLAILCFWNQFNGSLLYAYINRHAALHPAARQLPLCVPHVDRRLFRGRQTQSPR